MRLSTKQTNQNNGTIRIDFFNAQAQHIGYMEYGFEDKAIRLYTLWVFNEYRGDRLSDRILDILKKIAVEKQVNSIVADIVPIESNYPIIRDDPDFQVKVIKLIHLYRANRFHVTQDGEDVKAVFNF